MGDVVMPGDSLKEDVALVRKERKSEKEIVILGPGLRREGDAVLVCKAGVLRKREPAVYYVDSYQKRYETFILGHALNHGTARAGIIPSSSREIYRQDAGFFLARILKSVKDKKRRSSFMASRLHLLL